MVIFYFFLTEVQAGSLFVSFSFSIASHVLDEDEERLDVLDMLNLVVSTGPRCC